MTRTAQNLGNHELIGLNVKAFRASQMEFEGRVVDETMNTFVLEDGLREIRVPKHGYEFHFNLNNDIIKINGDRIRFRPEDRTKKVKGVRLNMQTSLHIQKLQLQGGD